MTRNIWVISDTHFGHVNIIKYCDRPFSSAKEMDEYILTMWNETVKDEDIVYHLGDVYFGSDGLNILPHLKGRKRLILGNHDNGKDQNLHRHFQKITMWRMFPEFDCVLSHVPIHESSLSKTNTMRNIHGHIHNNSQPPSDRDWETSST